MSYENLDILNINAGSISQLEILQPHFNIVQNSFITELTYQTKSNYRSDKTNKPITKPIISTNFSNRSFQDSINLSKSILIKHVKAITEGDNPPIIKGRDAFGNNYSVNLKYFQELFPEEDFKSIYSVWNSKLKFQDRYFCFLYGWNGARILCDLLYWCNYYRTDVQEIVSSRKRNEIGMTKSLFATTLNQLSKYENSPIQIEKTMSNGRIRIRLIFENIEVAQESGLDVLCDKKVLEEQVWIQVKKREEIKIPVLTVEKKGLPEICYF